MKKQLLFIAFMLAISACMLGCQKAQNEVVEISAGADMPFGGEMPEGMPDMGDLPGEMPSGGETPSADGQQSGAPQGGDAPGAASAADAGESDVIGKVQSIAGNYVTLLIGKSENGAITYGEDEESYLLPVGMSIGTGDFSSVSEGMVLKLTFEENSSNITAVTIVSR